MLADAAPRRSRWSLWGTGAADLVDMQEETTAADVKPIVSGLWLVMAIAIQVFVFGAIAWTVQDFAKLYEEIMPGVPLPGLTAMFLGMRPVGCIVVMMIMIFALVTKELFMSRRRARAWTSVGLAGVAGLVFVVYIIAVFRPLGG